MDEISKRITLQSSAVATGNGTAMTVLGYDNVLVQVEGITSATITFEVTENETDWYSVYAVKIGSYLFSTTATTDGLYSINVAGMSKLRARVSTYSSGTIIVTGRAIKGNAIGNLAFSTLVTALAKTVDSITSRPEGTTYINMTASALVRTGAGILVGMYVNSTSSGTIKFWDQTSAAVPVINNTITPAIGYHPLGNAAFATGLYATIANTLDVTLYYIPTP